MNPKKKKLSNPVGLNESPTYLGRCKAKTAEGRRCKHIVIFANGACAQHGGATPKEYRERIKQRSREIFEKRKRRLSGKIAKFDRLRRKVEKKKWPVGSSPAWQKDCRASAKAKTSTANPAAANRSALLSAPVKPGVDSTAAAASRQVRKQKPGSSEPLAISPARSPQPPASVPTRTLSLEGRAGSQPSAFTSKPSTKPLQPEASETLTTQPSSTTSNQGSDLNQPQGATPFPARAFELGTLANSDSPEIGSPQGSEPLAQRASASDSAPAPSRVISWQEWARRAVLDAQSARMYGRYGYMSPELAKLFPDRAAVEPPTYPD